MYYEDGFFPALSDQEEVCCGNIVPDASDGYQPNDSFDILLASLDRKEPNSLFSGNKFVDTLCKLPKLKLLEDQLKENGLESSDEESCVLQRPSDRVPSEEASRPTKVPLLRNPEGLGLPPPRLGPFTTHDKGLFPEPCLQPRPANFDQHLINGGLLPNHGHLPRFLAPHEQLSINNNMLLEPGLPPRPPLAPHEQEQLSMNNNLLLEQGPPLQNPPYSPVQQRAMHNGMQPDFSPGNPNQNGFHDHQNQRPFNKFNHRGRTRNVHPNRDQGFRYGSNFNNNRMNGDHPNHQTDRNNFNRNFGSRPNRTRMHPFENQHNDERAVNGRGNFSTQRGPKYFRSDNNGNRDPAFAQPKFQRGEQQFNRGRHFRGRRR